MLKRLAGPTFIVTGALHFLKPETYMKIMPPYLPAHRELVYASGVAEIAGGAALLHARTRRLGGHWLTATLVAIFPANLEMALHPARYGAESPRARALLYARLPLQLALIAWVRAAAEL